MGKNAKDLIEQARQKGAFELELFGMSMKQVPNEIGFCTAITRLNLGNNGLKGILLSEHLEHDDFLGSS